MCTRTNWEIQQIVQSYKESKHFVGILNYFIPVYNLQINVAA